MRITYFRIENFRNLRLAECPKVPSFMVLCGGNGSGKSALLEALMSAKERAGSYGQFRFDPRTVSVSADKAVIHMELAFNETERQFVRDYFQKECPESDEVVVEIISGGRGRVLKRSGPTNQLLGYYGRSMGSPGFFDYIHAHRQMAKLDLQNWDASYISEERAKQTLARRKNKFELTKRYLAHLKMRDLQAVQGASRRGETSDVDSLADIRTFFNDFFSPLRFKDVYIDRSPFAFVVDTPMGEIDIDDLSSGEKEILNIYVRFHQLKPNGSVILFDEVDAHLHPDLERRYLEFLRSLAGENQLIVTTHSPEMMIAAGSDALYTVMKEPSAAGANQLSRVTDSDELHTALSELMGSRGLVSFNQRIVFIEGEESSADRAIYEAFYPPAEYNVSFVPVGNSSMVRASAERVNALLETSGAFQQYFSIVDGDIERAEDDPTHGEKLFKLPVYHVENFLLEPSIILEATQAMLGDDCPYSSATEVKTALEQLLLDEKHIKPFAGALLDSELARLAKQAYDAVYKRDVPLSEPDTIDFADKIKEAEEMFRQAIRDGSWGRKCKGRELLKAYCAQHGFRYEHFRNLLISKSSGPPSELQEIMDQILYESGN